MTLTINLIQKVPTKRYKAHAYSVWLDDHARQRMDDLNQRLAQTLRLKVSNGVLLRFAQPVLLHERVAKAIVKFWIFGIGS